MNSIRRVASSTLGFALLAAVGACAGERYEVIPDRLEGKVNDTLSFAQVKVSPDLYKGQLVVFGGEVLSAKRLQDHTEVEILQLPLMHDYLPRPDRTSSTGRFLALDGGAEITDPAVLKEGTTVTIVGEITGSRTGSIGESEYHYPVISIRDMTVWNKDAARRPPWPYWAYGGGYYWQPYRWPYY